MEFILDMVHHNPGEAPFSSRFLDPAVLARYGWNGQVLKHINCALTFDGFDPEILPQGSPERAWVLNLRRQLQAEIAAARAQGLQVFFHVDFFVLPVRLVEKYREGLCDAQGRISLEAPLTLELHRALLDELFSVFPEVDGLLVRVGETYTFDTPYHMGNGPIRSVQYETSTEPEELEIRRYVTLLRFLRQEICVRHEKYLFFRTWDCYPDKFHADPDYYLAVTEAIEPHERLLFSVKHTALDFWRRVRENPCIGQGRHRQIIEVQCQREYEGKGAHPDYVMDGVLNGFSELRSPRGLRKLAENPLICGVFTWTRGGGWYGPYLPNELWCALHGWVMARWAGDPDRTEEELFREFARQELGLSQTDTDTLRRLCLLSAEAVLKGRYCEAYDRQWEEKITPTNLWMRDDRLGGEIQLRPVMEYLNAHGLWDDALAEKREAVALWQQIVELSRSITTGGQEDQDFIRTSCRYGLELYTLVLRIWELMAAREAGQPLAEPLKAYQQAWTDFRALETLPQCPTLYTDRYLNLPGTPEVPGIGETVEGMTCELCGNTAH